MEEKLVTYTLERDGKVFVVEHVPARVSKETGEAFFSPETVDKLQAIIGGKGVPQCAVSRRRFTSLLRRRRSRHRAWGKEHGADEK
jgi:hypothetical protein